MLETAIQYFLSLLSDGESSNKLPKEFVDSSINWMNLWLSKDLIEELSSTRASMVKKHAFIEESLQDLLKIPQFESQLKEKLNQYSSINNGNVINGSAIAVLGNFSQTVNHYHGHPPQITSKEHDNIKEVIKKVQSFVSAGQIARALSVLKQGTQDKFPDSHKETVQITGVWSDLTRRERVGTISIEESSRMRSQINERILNTAEEMLKA